MQLKVLVKSSAFFTPKLGFQRVIFMQKSLFELPDKQFKGVVRMDETSYVQLAQLICNHDVSCDGVYSCHKQLPVDV